MKKSSINLKINEFTGGYEIIYKGFSWVSDGRTPYIIIRKKISGKYISTYRTLYSAPKRNFEYSDGKIVTRLSGYVAFGKVLDFTLVLTAEITGEDTAEFSLKAENETGCDIQAVYFPAPFNSKKKGRCSYHVDAMRQGFCCPTDTRKILPPPLALPIICAKLTQATVICRYGGVSATVIPLAQS